MGSKPPEFSFFQVIFFFFPGYLFLFSRLSFSFFQVIFFFFPGSKPDIIIKTNKNKGFFFIFSGRDKYIVLGLSNSWGAGRQVTIPYEIGE